VEVLPVGGGGCAPEGAGRPGVARAYSDGCSDLDFVCVWCRCARCRYFDADTVGLDFKGMADDLKAAPDGSIVLLHGEECSAAAVTASSGIMCLSQAAVDSSIACCCRRLCAQPHRH
jgi:hypothetical protein